MENKVKTTVTGIHPETGEIHHREFEGDAVCIVTLNDKDGGISAQDALVGSLDLNRAMAMVKSLAKASTHLLEELPPHISSIIQLEMLKEIMGDMKDEQEEAADELA